MRHASPTSPFIFNDFSFLYICETETVWLVRLTYLSKKSQVGNSWAFKQCLKAPHAKQWCTRENAVITIQQRQNQNSLPSVAVQALWLLPQWLQAHSRGTYVQAPKTVADLKKTILSVGTTGQNSWITRSIEKLTWGTGCKGKCACATRKWSCDHYKKLLCSWKLVCATAWETLYYNGDTASSWGKREWVADYIKDQSMWRQPYMLTMQLSVQLEGMGYTSQWNHELAGKYVLCMSVKAVVHAQCLPPPLCVQQFGACSGSPQLRLKVFWAKWCPYFKGFQCKLGSVYIYLCIVGLNCGIILTTKFYQSTVRNCCFCSSCSATIPLVFPPFCIWNDR